MASVTAYNEIKTYLQGAFGPMPVLDFDAIETAIEQQTNSFLVLEEVFAYEDLIGIGDPSSLCMREDGSLFVHAFVPAPESSNTARSLAEQVQQQMRLRQLATVEIIGVSPPDPGVSNIGIWTSSLITIDYRTDIHAARQ